MSGMKTRGRAARLGAAALCLAAAVLAGACAPDAAQQAAEPEFEIVKSYEQGPLRIELKIERAKISVADRLGMVLEVTAPESLDVELPECGNELGEFGVADFRTAQPRLVDQGRVLLGRSYVLEPFLAGEYKIPPLTVRYTERQPDAEPREILTGEVTIEVASVLPAGEQQPEIKEIAAPVEMPAPWWPWLAGGIGVAALLTALLWWRRRKRLEREAIPPPAPHEIAYAELEKLLASGLLEKGEAKLFYLRLSNVLRRYIEDRFGLRAPEQTTEEFLAELRYGTPFRPQHMELLRSFLQHCDLVKFAELQPTREQAESTIALCRQFVGETKQEALGTLETVGAT
jgi:hypothetical protein